MTIKIFCSKNKIKILAMNIFAGLLDLLIYLFSLKLNLIMTISFYISPSCLEYNI